MKNVCHYLSVDMGRGDIMKKETNVDIGGGGPKIWHLRSDVIFRRPYKDFLSKWDQIRRKLRFWSHLLKKFLMENFIFCAVELNKKGRGSRT